MDTFPTKAETFLINGFHFLAVCDSPGPEIYACLYIQSFLDWRLSFSATLKNPP